MHNEYGIYYDSHNLTYKKSFGAVATESPVKFFIEVAAHLLNNVEVYLCLRGKRRVIDGCRDVDNNDVAKNNDGVSKTNNGATNIIEENGFRYEAYSEVVKMTAVELSTSSEAEGDGKAGNNGERAAEFEVEVNGCTGFVCEYTAPSKAITLEYCFKVEMKGYAGNSGCADWDGSDRWAQTVYYANNRRNAGGVGECYYSHDEAVQNKYTLTVYDKDFTTPDWFKNSIMYQIFPDRFCNGNDNGSVFMKEKEAGEYKVYSSWEDNMDLSYGYDDYERGERRIRNDFYGGNLRGLLKKVDYLKELGIDTIYLNPIFEAYSNHRYDTGDYMKIDPMLGTNDDFREVTAALKKQGIKLVLDGVFNHTGSDSRYFNKYGKYDSIGAAQSKGSPYAAWYTFKDFDANPNDYDCWWGISNVPNVNEMCESYFNYILGDDGVVQHWLKEGASGWRLDVADELPSEFLERLRSQVKAINKDALVIGEVWEDASRKYSYGEQREYLLGKQLDSVMNYPFYDVVLGFVGGQIRAEEMREALMRIHENYPRESLYALMNIIGTHDKPRAKTIFGGGAYRDANAPGNGNATYAQELANNRMKQAALFQMTYVGVPCIYYGDEIGMRGDGDPLNRGAFEWHDINEDVLGFYKAAIALRKEYSEFVSGEFNVLHAEGNVFAFERYHLVDNPSDNVRKNVSDYPNVDANNVDENGSKNRKSYIVVLNNSTTDWCNYYLDLNKSAVFGDMKAAFGETDTLFGETGTTDNVKVEAVFGMCYVDGKNISVPPTGGAVFEVL